MIQLLVGDKYGASEDQLLLLPNRDVVDAQLYYFKERQPGFTYKVKAKFVLAPKDLQDSPSYYFEYQDTISREKYAGNESFTIPIIMYNVVGGPAIQLNKIDDKFFYVSNKIQFTFMDSAVGAQLEEIWQNAKDIRNSRPSNVQPKWNQIKATVKHDPNKFGEAYLVEKIEFL